MKLDSNIEYGKEYLYTEVKEVVRKKQLYILDTVVGICQKHGLVYWLDGGTLLGAIRHQGFIPWDDDIDIGLMREDYSKLISVLNAELPNDLILQSIDSDSNYKLPFVKIRDRYSLVEDKYTYNGIFIDLFPFDEMPRHKSIKVLQRKLMMIFEAMFVHTDIDELNIAKQQNLKAKIVKLAMRTVSIFGKFTGIKGYKIYYEFLLWLSKVNPSMQIGDGLTASWAYDKSIRNYEAYLPVKKAFFEKKEYNIPNDYDKYLKTLYGNDYMVPIKSDNNHLFRVVFTKEDK